MTESELQTNKVESKEGFEALPTETEVFEAIAQMCGGKSHRETARKENPDGTLRSLEVRLDEPNAEGHMVQLDYQVSRSGVATIDVVYFDPGKGTDYRSYEYSPMDIVPGGELARFVDGEFVSSV